MSVIKSSRHIPALIFIAVSALVLASSCKSKKEETSTEENPTQDSTSVQKDTTTKTAASFSKTLKFNEISFDVSTTGEGSLRQLSIQPAGLQSVNDKVSQEIDGQVVDAVTDDLNADGSPELLIFTQSAGSGGYGNVIAYSVNNGKSMSQVYFPEITEDSKASKGYMGHDKFSVANKGLVRTFPIYKEQDSNSNPTGGVRTIKYSLKEGEASRKFEISKIEDGPGK